MVQEPSLARWAPSPTRSRAGEGERCKKQMASDKQKCLRQARGRFTDVSDQELAKRLKKHDLEETEASVANKLSRGTFAATLFLAALVALEVESVSLEDI